MTNETTPDAVAMLKRMHARAVHSENRGDEPRIGSDEVLAVLRATHAERARHAEDVLAVLRVTQAERARHAEEVSALRAQLRRAEGERDAERGHATEMEERALDLVRDLRLAQVELTSLRSLLPDVRACAEYIVERGVDNADGSARRILAALDSQGGEGECLDRSDAPGVDGDRCESGNECGRLGCPECQS